MAEVGETQTLGTGARSHVADGRSVKLFCLA
jgi:hypothetical protein